VPYQLIHKQIDVRYTDTPLCQDSCRLPMMGFV
jgi:hypothetical protein